MSGRCWVLCRRNPELQDAVATLARHLCLRAPDKADNRAAAIKAAAELVVELPQWEQEQFVGFVFELSRTKQVRWRGALRSAPLHGWWTTASACCCGEHLLGMY